MRAERDSTIVILTGAGISKESGLDTFRCAGGIWSRVDLEDVATPEGYARDPVLVQALLTVALFPIFGWLFIRVHRAFLQV